MRFRLRVTFGRLWNDQSQGMYVITWWRSINLIHGKWISIEQWKSLKLKMTAQNPHHFPYSHSRCRLSHGKSISRLLYASSLVILRRSRRFESRVRSRITIIDIHEDRVKRIKIHISFCVTCNLLTVQRVCPVRICGKYLVLLAQASPPPAECGLPNCFIHICGPLSHSPSVCLFFPPKV